MTDPENLAYSKLGLGSRDRSYTSSTRPCPSGGDGQACTTTYSCTARVALSV